MSTLRPLVGIARYELLRVARDRLTLFFLVVLPMLVVIIIGSTFGGAVADLPIGIHIAADSAVDDLTTRLESSDALRVTYYEDLNELKRDIRTGRQLGGLTIIDNTRTGSPITGGLQLTLLTDQISGAAGPVRTAVRGIVDLHGAELTAANVATELGAAGDTSAALDRARAMNLEPTIIERIAVGDGQEPPDSQYAYTVPSQLVLFVFVAALGAGAALVDINRLGISRRMLSAPVSVTTLVGGLTVARFLLAAIQAALLIGVGAIFFNVSWGDPLAVVALVTLYSIVAVGAGLVVGSMARTSEQAMAIGVPLAMGMGMLGGTMWPLDLVGDTMRTVGHAVPHAWIMDGWVTLIFDRGGIADITTELAVLAGFAVLLLAVGSQRLRHQLTHHQT